MLKMTKFRNERGQTMVEFALVLPILLVLLLGIFQFGIAFNNYVTLTDAVRAGARKAAVSRQASNPSAACSRRGDRREGRPRRDAARRRTSRARRRWAAGSDVTVTADYPYSISLLGWTVVERPLQLDHEGACGMSASRKKDDGQAIVLTVLAMVAVLGMCALVLDVGSWFRTQRRLPGDRRRGRTRRRAVAARRPRAARSRWRSATRTRTAATSSAATSSSRRRTTRTTRSRSRQRGRTPASSRRCSASSRRKAHGAREGARRRAGPGAGRRADGRQLHPPADPELQRRPTPTFDVRPRLDYDPLGAPGAFGMLNLDPNGTNPGTSEEAAAGSSTGYNKYLGLGIYRSDPGAKFSSQNIQSALQARIGTVLLFPVFKTLDGTGSERRVRHHRLDRLPPHELRRARQQRHADGLLHANTSRRESSRRCRIGKSPPSFGRQVDSTHRLVPQAISRKRKDYELPRQEHRHRRRSGALAAILTSVYVVNYKRHVQHGEGKVKVLVAARDIPAGTTGADVIDQHDAQAADRPAQGSRRRARSRRPTSSPSTSRPRTSSTASRSARGASLRPTEQGIRAQIKGTQRAFELAGDSDQLLAGTLKDGDHVDVVGTGTSRPAAGPAATTLRS